ncbi:hypothetical protein [Vampirovibrio sp.]
MATDASDPGFFKRHPKVKAIQGFSKKQVFFKEPNSLFIKV